MKIKNFKATFFCQTISEDPILGITSRTFVRICGRRSRTTAGHTSLPCSESVHLVPWIPYGDPRTTGVFF